MAEPKAKKEPEAENKDKAGEKGRGLKIAAVLLALVLAVGAGAWFWGLEAVLDHRADPAGKAVVVDLPKGAGLKQIAGALNQAGVIDHPWLFTLAARLSKRTSLKAGEYSLSPAQDYRGILDTLAKGRVLLHKVVIPEGFTLEQIVERLASAGLVDGDRALDLARDPKFAAGLGVMGQTLEGYLFPDTYSFARGLGETAVLTRMVRRFNEQWERLEARAGDNRLDQRQTVILASIIEREAMRDDERPLVSAVYHNRLAKGMPLQADPTVIYGIPDFEGLLTREDLDHDSPYNTYLIKGLPPGPICSPGAASLAAALNPADSKHLYFVARGDGSHQFSRTYTEHRRAVRRYRGKGK